jgi:uncharacterized membrane protein YfcA
MADDASPWRGRRRWRGPGRAYDAAVHAHDWLLLSAAGLGAGVVNAIAGGGSLLSFPALLVTGMPSVTANATNTLAIWPGTLSSVWAYRRLIAGERHRAWVLTWPSMAGGLAGSVLLLHTPEKAFRAVVPWLILFACALLAMQGPVARLVARAVPGEGERVPAALCVAQLLISVYGGYFGAGIGILMLAAMAIFLPDTLQHANALKVLFSMLINGVAAVYFLAVGAASLPEAGLMALASTAGGYAGAHLAQRLRAGVLRAVVVAYGVVVALRLFQTG